MDLDLVKAFIHAQSPETSVYLGCDSERVKVNGVWHADYALAVVVHIDSCHGCKIFGEVHLDINPDQMHKSSVVVNQAIGYIKGTCNVIPMVKPRAFAASYAADRLDWVLSNRKAA